MTPALLALALALAQGGDDDAAYDEEPRAEERSEGRLRVAGWGGTVYDVDARDGIPFAGGEVSWALDRMDVGVLAQAYRFGRQRASAEWGPVILARLEQRFATRRGLEAALAFGVGAGRERGWSAWFQFGGGVRVVTGPFFVGGEVGFEQDRFFRFGATAGLATF